MPSDFPETSGDGPKYPPAGNNDDSTESEYRQQLRQTAEALRIRMSDYERKEMFRWMDTRKDGRTYYLWSLGVKFLGIPLFIVWLIVLIIVFKPPHWLFRAQLVPALAVCIWAGRRRAKRLWNTSETKYLTLHPDAPPPGEPFSSEILRRHSLPPPRRVWFYSRGADVLLFLTLFFLVALYPSVFPAFNDGLDRLIDTVTAYPAPTLALLCGAFGVACVFLPGSLHALVFIPLCGRTPGMWLCGIAFRCKDDLRLWPVEAVRYYWAPPHRRQKNGTTEASPRPYAPYAVLYERSPASAGLPAYGVIIMPIVLCLMLSVQMLHRQFSDLVGPNPAAAPGNYNLIAGIYAYMIGCILFAPSPQPMFGRVKTGEGWLTIQTRRS